MAEAFGPGPIVPLVWLGVLDIHQRENTDCYCEITCMDAQRTSRGNLNLCDEHVIVQAEVEAEEDDHTDTDSEVGRSNLPDGM